MLPEVLLRFKATLILTAGALVIAVVLGVPAGIVSATRQYTWLDKLGMGIAVTGQSLPVFWTGIMLIIVFALSLRWFPSAGMTSPYGGGERPTSCGTSCCLRSRSAPRRRPPSRG